MDDLPSIGVTLNRTVNVMLPPVYRFFDKQQYADQLVDNGRIRLSSFRAFKKHKDEQRGDGLEGSTHLIGQDKEADRHFGVYRSVGLNAYVLSSTLTPSKDIGGLFNCDSCVEITNILEFAAVVGGEILGFQHALLGHCLYREDKMILSDTKNITLDDFRDDSEPEKESLDKMLRKANELGGNQEYFLKTQKYSAQQEYRFVWLSDRNTNDFLDVENAKLKALVNRIY